MNGGGRRAATLALLLAAATAACGIRSTDVPVDGGPAPTRATCESPEASGGGGDGGTGANDAEGAAAEETSVTEVYLVCGTQVEAVRRTVELPAHQENPVALARALLKELQADPGHAEQAAGFSSDVPPDLSVAGTVSGSGYGPGLRLSEGPGDLPAFALVQIICTFAHSEPLGNGHSVVLSGPPGSTSERPKPYSCSAAMRASPNAPAG